MSEPLKDNKDFVFIKEQIRPRKRNSFKKFLIQFFTMAFMAVVFGLVAAVTFCITEPRLYKLLHKNSSNLSNMVTPITQIPSHEDEPDNNEEPDDDLNVIPENEKQDDVDDRLKYPENTKEDNHEVTDDSKDDVTKVESPKVIVEKINANIDDYLAMYKDLRKISSEAEKSILTVSSIIKGKDWFGNPIEKEINTSGLVLETKGNKIKVLVSLDRVKDASSIKVQINENVAVDAVLYDYETELNLAVITINVTDVPVKFFDKISVASLGESFSLSAGSPVIALGNPNGYTSSIDIGIVTSKGNTVSITDNEVDIFHTNMTFNSDSDGVIVNTRGEIVGLITRTIKEGQSKGLSTVLGISKIKSYIEKMLSQSSRVYCGVIAENLSQAAMTEYNVINGVYVYEVLKDSPAFKAGLKSGDIILNVGDKNIFNMNNFYNAISELEPGLEVLFKIKRTSGSSDKEMELTVILESKQQ